VLMFFKLKRADSLRVSHSHTMFKFHVSSVPPGSKASIMGTCILARKSQTPLESLLYHRLFSASLGYGAASRLLRRSTTSTDSTETPSSLMMHDDRGAPRIQAHAYAPCSIETRQFLSIRGSYAQSPHSPCTSLA
jgi:hypothetical protein